jgi:hypothetical protein
MNLKTLVPRRRLPVHFGSFLSTVAVVAGCLSQNIRAEDWGGYVIVPVSAQPMALEFLDAEPHEGTSPSVVRGKPSAPE